MLHQLLFATQQTHATSQKRKNFLHVFSFCTELQTLLKENNWKPSRFSCFCVEDPKPREIFAPDYPDRIVHQFLVRQLEEKIEPRFHEESFANRPKKGVLKAIQKLQKWIYKKTDLWALQLDIRTFFPSIDHNVLFFILSAHIKRTSQWTESQQTFLLQLCQKIIFHDPTSPLPIFTGNISLLKKIPKEKSLFGAQRNKGLPIGSLTSQFFANVYLHELDRFIKHTLRARYYIRYVDDILLLDPNPQKLLYWKNEIDQFLKNSLKLSLHPKKIHLQTLSKGINFLGFFVKPQVIFVRQRSVKALKKRLQFFKHLFDPQNVPYCNPPQTLKIAAQFRREHWILPVIPTLPLLQHILASINSYYGLFRHANTFHLRCDIYHHHFGILQNFFEPKDQDFYCFKIRDEYINSHENSL